MSSTRIQVDVVVVGAGIAGLWLLDLLRGQGYSVAICDPGPIGGRQTMLSQGIIHGGLKYALGAHLTRDSEAIAEMPKRWRARPDLPIVHDHYYLWAPKTLSGTLTSFLASRLVRGRVEKVDSGLRPAPFASTRGTLYRLEDFVIDVPALIRQLALKHAQAFLPIRVDATNLTRNPDGSIAVLRAAGVELTAQRYVFAAGAGNEDLVDHSMQRRPLRQVLVRGAEVGAIFAHCLTRVSDEPALTITTHGPDSILYIGGRVASALCAGPETEQIEATRQELATCFPNVDWNDAQFETVSVDRAEPAQNDLRRPDEAFVSAESNAIVCWPTKLTLAPDLGNRVLDILADTKPMPSFWQGNPRPSLEFASPPW